MDYNLVYQNIILNAKMQGRNKGLNLYLELHHIQPVCLGGTNDSKNLVLLTAKEHYICHHLLCKIYPKENSLWFAFMNMSRSSSNQERYLIPSRVYNIIKEKISDIKSEKWKNPLLNPNSKRSNKGENNPMFGVHRFGEENPFFGKIHTEETKRKMSNKRKMYYENNENNTKNSIWINNGIFNKRLSKDEIIPEGYSEGLVVKTCPHCNTVGGGANMTKYHFDKCKLK